jgi:hypothetical protein
MIPIACPNCGREGSVPPDRLNAQLRCKGCNAQFHMDGTGRIVLGTIGSKPGKAPRPKSRQTSEPFSLAEVLEGIPKPVRLGAPVLAAVALVGYFGWSVIGALFAPASPKVPAEAIANAVAEGQRDKVLGMTSPETKDDAGKWYDQARARLTKLGMTKVNNAVAAPLAFDPQKRESLFDAYFAFNTGDPDLPTGTEHWEIYLVQDPGGHWLLDGKRTLDAADPGKRFYAPLPKGKK